MSEYSKIDTFLDIDKLKAEAQAFHKILDETIAKIRSFGTVEVKLSAGSSKEAIKAIGDVNSLQVQLTQTQKEYNRILNDAIALKAKHNGATKEVLSATNALAAAEVKGAKASAESAKARLTDAKASTEAAKARQANAKALEAEARYKERVRKESERIEKAQVKEEKVVAELTNDYKLFSKAYEEAALRAKNMALVMGSNHPLVVEAAADAKKMSDKLMELDAITGRHTRNVGNYASAQFALTQVLREAPAFANSFNTGLMGISNNIPILTDEFKKLKASGLSTTQALKVLSGTLFSLGSVLPFALLFFQLFSEEIAAFGKALFGSKKQVDEFTRSQEQLNEAMKSSEYKDVVTSIDEMRDKIQLAKDGFLSKEKVLRDYNDTIGKTIGKASDLNEAEQLLIKNAPAYMKMLLLKSAAEQMRVEAAGKLVEAERVKLDRELRTRRTKGKGLRSIFVSEEEQEQQEKFLKSLAVKQSNLLKEEGDLMMKAVDGFMKQIENIAKENNFNLEDIFGLGGDGKGGSSKDISVDLKSQFEIIKRSLEEQIKLYTDLANAEGMSIKSRQEARMKAGELTRELLRAERDFEIAEVRAKLDESLKAEDLTAKNILTLRQNAANEIANIRDKADSGEREAQIDFTNDLLNIWGKYREQQKKQMEDDLKLFKVVEKDKEAVAITAASEAMQRRQNELSRARDILLKDLEQRRSQGTVGEKEYQKERLRIELEYNEKILLAELDFIKKSLEAKKLAGKDVTEELKRIAALELEITRKKNEEIEKREKELQQRKIERIERIRDISREAIDTIATFLTADVDRQKNAIVEQMELIDKKKAKEIEAAEQSAGSEEQKAAKVALINARAQSQKEALERRQRQLDIQRAQFEKAADIANIIASTAMAVVHQLESGDPYTAIARAATVGAIGAAQLARAIATPIPKFAEGTDDAPGGLAIVGDGGKREIVITPAGETFITPDTPTFMNIPQHSIVHPDAGKIMDDLKYSAFANLRVSIPGQDPNVNDVIVSTLEREFKGLKQTIKNKKELHVSGTHAGVSALHKHNNNWLNYLNDQVNF